MGLPRTFVGFSSTDIHYFRLMLAWKSHEHIDFDFCNCQLAEELNTEDERYIKDRCRERLEMAGYYILLIGADTRYKHKYVLWEAEVAVEKGCTIIGVNINKNRFMDGERTPSVIRNVGALFVTFSPPIVAVALETFRKRPNDNWWFDADRYKRHGYIVDAVSAYRPKPQVPDFLR